MILENIENYTFAIIGFKDARVPDSQKLLRLLRSRFPKVEIQVFRADRIAGPEHLRFAAAEAIAAFRQRRARSRTLAVELMLYTSCQRQISKAIQLLGISPSTHNVIMAALTREKIPSELVQTLGATLGAQQDDSVVDISSGEKVLALMKTYGLSNRTMAAARLSGEDAKSVLKRLVIESSALLAVEKQ